MMFKLITDQVNDGVDADHQNKVQIYLKAK